MALRGYAKPADCTCTHLYTCGVCCRAAKPWHWTPSPKITLDTAYTRGV